MRPFSHTSACLRTSSKCTSQERACEIGGPVNETSYQPMLPLKDLLETTGLESFGTGTGVHGSFAPACAQSSRSPTLPGSARNLQPLESGTSRDARSPARDPPAPPGDGATVASFEARARPALGGDLSMRRPTTTPATETVAHAPSSSIRRRKRDTIPEITGGSACAPAPGRRARSSHTCGPRAIRSRCPSSSLRATGRRSDTSVAIARTASSSPSAPTSRRCLPAAGSARRSNTTKRRRRPAAALDHAHPRDSATIEPPEASISDLPERLTHESAGRARKSLAAHQRLDPAHTPNDPLSCARRHAAITAPKPDRTTIASTCRVITPLKRTPLRALPPDSRHGQENEDCTLTTQSSTQYNVELWVVIVSCATSR